LGHRFYGSIAKRSKNYPKIHDQTKGEGEGAVAQSQPEYATGQIYEHADACHCLVTGGKTACRQTHTSIIKHTINMFNFTCKSITITTLQKSA